MSKRRRLDPDEPIIGQTDIFGGEVTDQPAVVIPISGRYRLPKMGEARYYSLSGKQACDLCFAAQAAADRAGLPIPRRRFARWRREARNDSGIVITYICQSHAQVMHTLDTAR